MSIKEKIKKIPRSWSPRKGCFFCRGPLNTPKEKILRSCNGCAKETLEGFNKMSDGKIKEGFSDVKKIVFGQSKQAKQIGEHQMKAALNKRRKKIEKKLRKKGMTEEQITEGLAMFDKSLE